MHLVDPNVVITFAFSLVSAYLWAWSGFVGLLNLDGPNLKNPIPKWFPKAKPFHEMFETGRREANALNLKTKQRDAVSQFQSLLKYLRRHFYRNKPNISLHRTNLLSTLIKPT